MVKEKEQSWHKSMKESLKREDDLVPVTAEIEEEFRRGGEKNDELVRCYETWAQSKKRGP